MHGAGLSKIAQAEHQPTYIHQHTQQPRGNAASQGLALTARRVLSAAKVSALERDQHTECESGGAAAALRALAVIAPRALGSYNTRAAKAPTNAELQV